jgi:phage FluMu gp28-like protein
MSSVPVPRELREIDHPELHRTSLEVQAAARLILLDREYKQDPWAWYASELMTQDEALQRKVPWPIDKIYTKDLVWILSHENLIAIPKSRRVLASWTVAAWLVYAARYHEFHAAFWQSDTETKAAYATDKRCAFIEDNLVTKALRRPYIAHRTKDGLIGKLEYSGTKSYIWAVPQGDAVIRSFTPSKLVMDESEFQPEAHSAFTAALPLAEKGAQLIVLSSSNGSSGVLAGICREVGFVRFQ